MRTPSRTATKIARFMLLLDSLPRLRGVLPPGAAATVEAILRGSRAVPVRRIDAMRAPSTARFYELTERWLGRGQLLCVGWRARSRARPTGAACRPIDASRPWCPAEGERSARRSPAVILRRALAAGTRQLLVVGAGFDPLAVGIAAAHPGVLSVEIDAPATAEPKRAGVEGAGLARPNHRIMAADLSRRALAEVLAETPWRTGARSVVIAEGLLMYLAPDDVRAFFTAVRAVAGEGSRVAFSSLDADERGRPHIGALDLPIRIALRIAGEPMRWGIRPDEVPAFLAALGHRALEQPTIDALRARCLDPLGLHEEPLLPYEHLVLSDTASHADREQAK